jgi:hypothetical protein
MPFAGLAVTLHTSLAGQALVLIPEQLFAELPDQQVPGVVQAAEPGPTADLRAAKIDE